MDAGADGKAERVRSMFAEIVPRYDAINGLMALGLDHYWRRAAVEMAKPRGGFALDIATGTGDLAVELARQGSRVVLGVDFCPEMMAAAVEKARTAAPGAKIAFVAGDAMRLPFPDDTFDCIVNGFMLRNVADLPTTFNELRRVLKPGGRLVCLDLTPPRGPLRRLASLYIDGFVPILGGIVSGHFDAYRYLARSLSLHPDADTLCSIMREAGLSNVDYRLMGFGTVAAHFGGKDAKPASAAQRRGQAS
jgi:demethylmenaquinone methyltransferase / 2-methoxy-6-polyprenyl-1,4-benzoquinol methylase